MTTSEGWARPIKSYYYNHKKELIRTNSGVHVDMAVPRAIFHMQTEEYGARVCEVIDINTGQLWAVVTRDMARKISILYKRDIEVRPKGE